MRGCAVLLLCLATGWGESVREKVSFDFSWRHRLGEVKGDASQPGYDDSEWGVVSAPHDMLIVQPFDKQASEKQAFLSRGVGWYRKHFRLPEDWEGSAVWLYVEGSFHQTTVWLNGVKLTTHAAGYTSFAVRLDTVAGVTYGAVENVVALYVDASSGTGWWYEGGGLMRHNYLVRAGPVHIATDSAWAFAQDISVADGTASVVTSVEVENGGKGEAVVSARVVVRDQSGAVVGGGSGGKVTVGVGASVAVPQVTVGLKNVSFWSVQRPYLYSVEVSLEDGGVVVDTVNVTTGIRGLRWDADHGLFVNGEHVKLRGFCDHSNFGGLGGAVPERVNLFRAQMLRSVGGNSWRMAHNPPVPARLDIMDRLGMLAIDENRDYGGQKGQGGTTNETVTDELQDMADLVRRDRSHPSVMIWSFCNEVGCNNESSAKAFREVSKLWDPTRAVTQNHHGTSLSTAYLDVQGFSHKSSTDFANFHKEYPTKAIMATECCSCMSQRGVDEDSCPQPHDGGCESPPKKLPDGVFYNNNIGECTSRQVIASDAPEYVTGTFVWSGFDYLGESRGWPQNVKCRGTVGDVAGFYKETAYWLKSVWLSNISISDAGRPRNPPYDAAWTVFIVESWTPPPRGTTRSVHVYSNAPSVRLELNGKAVGTASIPFFGMATFDAVPYEVGNLTAVAVDARGSDVAQHTIRSAGGVTRVILSLDAPSAATGTGTALVADGQDTAMVRATLVDDNGVVVPWGDNNVTFTVVSGEGAIWGTHNGDPANTSPNHAPWTPAYIGLARAFVRSTADRATPLAHRKRVLQIDADVSPSITVTPDTAPTTEDIVVQVDVPGIPPARITIPVSTDTAHSPLAVASSTFQ